LSSGSFSLTDLIKEQDEKRRTLIKEIQQIAGGTKVINYCTNWGHPAGNIIRPDLLVFNEMLSALQFPEKLDLIIHSPGGIVEVAETIVATIRDSVKSFRVLVPEAAKSAATLIALGSDEILMSPIAELGPIDPAIVVGTDPVTRQPIFRPAWSYINSLKRLEEEIKGGRDPNIIIPLVHKIDPTLLDVARNALDYSKSLAAKWMHQYMHINETEAAAIAERLQDVSQHLSHARAIRLKEIQQMGIKASLMPAELWSKVHELYVRSTFALAEKRVKLIECEAKSLFGEV